MGQERSSEPGLASKILTDFHIWDSISDMESSRTDDTSIDQRIARRLKGLRKERGWTLDQLAGRSAVSRASLSRLENGEVSPTASMLGKLCAAYGLTISRLMYLVEDDFMPLIRRDAQPVWADLETGFRRRSLSPPAQSLAGEALDCALEAGQRIAYERPPRPGLEHHLLLIEGRLQVAVDGQVHDLRAGDCLRYQLFGPSAFTTPEGSGARYILFIV